MVEQRRTVPTAYGDIEYVLTVKRVKNLNLRLRPDGTVAVSVGRRVPVSAADEFVRGRAAWILDHQARRVEPVPALAFPDKAEAMPLLLASLERMWPLAAPLGVEKPELRGRKMVSRWGSCHYAKGVVVMNTALAAVPAELLDYVTLHELVHFLHPDHGKGFYAVMDRLMPDWREKRKALKGYRLER